ncbi:hypothetical protein ASG36_20340 [Geodermatophilus sp. Leaf369]|nr:hypothetical protein ASG36_20340 [Geodermatophilus sp. Leaf369]
MRQHSHECVQTRAGAPGRQDLSDPGPVGNPEMVVARFLTSLAVAVVMGWLWTAWGRDAWLTLPRRASAPPGTSRSRAFADAARHDIVHAGGFLVVGGLTAATLNVVVPRSWLDALANNPALAVSRP